METCLLWGSTDKDIGITQSLKNHCRDQFQDLMRIQMENGQISYTDMTKPADIDSKGKELDSERPTGAKAEQRQYAKADNAEHQIQLRRDKRRRNESERHEKAVW